MAEKLPRLLIAGLSGDSGKTIVSLSLLTALSQKGLAVEAISHGRLAAEAIHEMITGEAINESKRYMSCGICFDCGTRWSFCQDNVIIKPLVRSEEYTFKMEFCNGSNKCAVCLCGYIEMH